MNTQPITIDSSDARRLLGAASGDAALLYIYLRCGNDPATAEQALHLPQGRLSCAMATLRQLGLWQEEKRAVMACGERPNYSEKDVLRSLDTDPSFRRLYGEIQRRLGRQLNTEELKVILSLVRYLGLPADVICVLVTYCQERARRKGSIRNPSLRTIEKEAYAWAERGIDTMEEAAAYIQNQNVHNARMYHIRQLLQIRGRWLTAAEEKYAASWLDMGFDDQAILMAYERTCINTGALKWPYMNSILQRWHKQGMHTGAQIAAGDRKPESKDQRELSPDEMEAIRRMMEED